MRKVICIIALLLSFTACGPRSEIEDLKKDVKSLKEADAALWEEMTAAIDKLEQELLGRIQATRDRLNKTIDEALEDLYGLIDTKLEATEKYFETEIAAKKALVDQNAEDVRNNTDKAVDNLDIALQHTRSLMMKAIADGQQERAELLEQLSKEIESMTGQVEDAWEAVDGWRQRLDNLQDEGIYQQIEKLEKNLVVLKSFDLQKDVDFAEARLKKYANIVLDDLTEDQIKEVNGMLETIEDYYTEVENFMDEADGMADEMESMLDEWSSSADDLYSEVSSYTDELADRLDTFSSMIEESYEQAVEMAGSVEDWKNYLETLNTDLQDFKDRSETIADDLEGNHDDLEAKTADIIETRDYLGDMASDLLEICEQFESSHPWMFD